MVRHRTRSPSEHPQQGGQEQGQEQNPDDIQAEGQTLRGHYRYRRRHRSHRRLYRVHRRRRCSCRRRRRRRRRTCRHRRQRRGLGAPLTPPGHRAEGSGRLMKSWDPPLPLAVTKPLAPPGSPEQPDNHNFLFQKATEGGGGGDAVRVAKPSWTHHTPGRK